MCRGSLWTGQNNKSRESEGPDKPGCKSRASFERDWKGGAPGAPLVAHRRPSLPLQTLADTFLHYRTSKVRALRAARLERLVHELVSGDREQDPGFVPAFLATHHAFVPTACVLRFLLPPPPPPLPPGSVATGTRVSPALDPTLDLEPGPTALSQSLP